MGIRGRNETVGEGSVDDEVAIVGNARTGLGSTAETERRSDGAKGGEAGEDVGGGGGEDFDRDRGVVGRKGRREFTKI